MEKIRLIALIFILAFVCGCGDHISESESANATLNEAPDEQEGATSKEEVYYKTYENSTEEENAREAYSDKTEDGVEAYSDYIRAELGEGWDVSFEVHENIAKFIFEDKEVAQLDIYDFETDAYSADILASTLGVHFSEVEVLNEETKGNVAIQKVKLYIDPSATESEEGMEGFSCIHYFLYNSSSGNKADLYITVGADGSATGNKLADIYGYMPYDDEFDENYGSLLDEIVAGITLK